jgi:hypothetical protein
MYVIPSVRRGSSISSTPPSFLPRLHPMLYRVGENGASWSMCYLVFFPSFRFFFLLFFILMRATFSFFLWDVL